MMKTTCDSGRALGAVTVLLLLPLFAAPGIALGADRFETIESVFEAHGARHPRLSELVNPNLSPRDALFLEKFFEELDDLIVANANVLQWFASDGRSGMHPADYLERCDGLIENVEKLEPPRRAQALRDYAAETIGLQRGFISDWFTATEGESNFVSPLVDENAYHEGLHRSHRLHLKIYAELLAVFPETSDVTHHAFRAHLKAMGLR